jgi:asparagine synthase (glutamine-hydrolysing)
MCGINGIFAYHYAANPVDRAELLRTRDHMAARGPDGKGAWFGSGDRIGVGHRRLSIIDLTEAGAQPMQSADGKVIVVFNGEIYNHVALRRELEERSHRFRSTSDTEVLIHLYAEKGADMVADLRGMFAFALWDNEKSRLLLARDPFGIKPLYYADDGWTFRFASQVKALIEGGNISRDAEPAGNVGFYIFGSVPEPYTTFAAVRALPAGTTMIVDRLGGQPPRSYHSIASVHGMPVDDLDKPSGDLSTLRAAFADSVACHLVSDVPVGAFLSAGVDSGALVGLMRDAGARAIKTVTLAFEEFRGTAEDEAPLAAEVARYYGADHHSRIVRRSEFERDLPRIFSSMDQPSIDGINAWFVAKAAHELGLKVVMSGIGGDELLGGYPSFRDLPRWVRATALPARVPMLGCAFRHLITPFTSYFGVNPKAAGMLEFGGSYAGAYLLKRGLFMPWELSKVLDPETIEAGLRRLDPIRYVASNLAPYPKTSFGKVATLETALYMRNQLLRDTDWASMAHSLEVRVPFVDSVLLASIAPHRRLLEACGGKRLLASAPSKPLPAAVVDRKKTGFVTPIKCWMQDLASRAPSSSNGTHSGENWARDWSSIVMSRVHARPGTA